MQPSYFIYIDWLSWLPEGILTVGCELRMLLLTLSLLSVALGDPLLECKPTGACNCVVEGLSSGPAEIDLRPLFEDGTLRT